MGEKSKILVIGGTGYIGKFIVKAGAEAGHPTFALIRETKVSDPQKATLLESFKSSGVKLLYGDINDHNSLVEAIKKVDVVISCVGMDQISDQVKIIAAINETGNIKRFLPSEFGSDVDHLHPVEPARTLFRNKSSIRRAIEAAGIPYTYVVSYSFAGYMLPTLGDLNAKVPPKEKGQILGDGNSKGVFVVEEDIATYTIKAVEDPRNLNKVLKLRPPTNILSFNEIFSMWEKKIGKTLERIYIPEDQVLKKIQESTYPSNLLLSISHAKQVKGDDWIFETDAASCVEATELYPEVKYTTIDEYLDRLV